VIVEVIAVGTELLIGQIVNSNAAVIGERLAAAGFDAHYQVTVGDNLDRLTAAIRHACGRADAVILTGGIGPTQDDLTRDALCAVAGVEMTRDRDHEQKIRERLSRVRGAVAEINLRMADHPAGSETMPNSVGVALGVAMEHQGTHLYAVPGVPSEMVAMLDDQVLPRLRALAGEPAILTSRILRTFGYGESQVAELLDDLYESTNPSIAFLIDAAEVRVRISAKAESAEVAEELIAGMEAEVVDRLGDAVFGRDDETVERLLVDALQTRGWTIATIEASTLGVVGTRLADSPGAGEVFAGTRVVPPVAAPAGLGSEDVEARALELLDGTDAGSSRVADVIVAVSEISAESDDDAAARTVGVAVRTPEGTRARSVAVLGDEVRARRFSVPNALHAARTAVTGTWWAS
jgi:nicotinamide-nucleotide amidase